MSASNDERQLWQWGSFACVMVSCCSGAELQLRRKVDALGGEDVVLRELYPMKSDLYERARELEAEYSKPLRGSRALESEPEEP